MHTGIPATVFCPLSGVTITPFTRSTLLTALESKIGDGKTHLIVGHNLHSAYLYHSDAKFQDIYNRADIILADGKPIAVDAARVLKRNKFKQSVCERLGSTDWLPLAFSLPALARIAVVGASPTSNNKLVDDIKAVRPDIHAVGIPGHAWNETKAKQVVNDLRDFEPDLVLVGLGMPLQEHFVSDYSEQLPPAVYALVGGAIDQLVGTQKNAPRWLGNLGLEWAWRLVSQPKRLSHRYLVEPWKLAHLRLRRRVDPS